MTKLRILYRILRNLLHMGGFGVLAWFALRCFKNRKKRLSLNKTVFWGIVVSLGIIFLCEIYQMLLPFRRFEWIDVAMDGIGVALAVFVFYIYVSFTGLNTVKRK